MSTTDHTREALTEIVREHRNSYGVWPGCSCGWFSYHDRHTNGEPRTWDEHMVDVLTARVAAVVAGKDAEIERLTMEADQAIAQAEDWSATAAVLERERGEARAALAAERERAWDEGAADADAAWKSAMAMSITGRESIANPYRIARSTTDGGQ